MMGLEISNSKAKSQKVQRSKPQPKGWIVNRKATSQVNYSPAENSSQRLSCSTAPPSTRVHAAEPQPCPTTQASSKQQEQNLSASHSTSGMWGAPPLFPTSPTRKKKAQSWRA